MPFGMKWLNTPIKAILIDITGVLYESGTKAAIPKSIEAINKLRASGLPFRLLTNETQHPVRNLLNKLNSFGYDFHEEEIIAPMLMARNHLLKHHLRPYLLVYPDVLPEFESVPKDNPNCVVIGDAAKHFTYEATNKAFQLLISLKDQESKMTEIERRSILISMGKNKFYKEDGELVLDLGAYTTALEYACDLTAMIIGKPSAEYFLAAIAEMGADLKSTEVLMIGDDIIGDVKGAQDCGLRGVLVRSGKFRLSDENHPLVKPDAFVDNLYEAVERLLQLN